MIFDFVIVLFCCATLKLIQINVILFVLFRYTHPDEGIEVRIAIFKIENKVRFHIYVTDYCPEGFPDKALNFLRNRIVGLKISDCRVERRHTGVSEFSSLNSAASNSAVSETRRGSAAVELQAGSSRGSLGPSSTRAPPPAKIPEGAAAGSKADRLAPTEDQPADLTPSPSSTRSKRTDPVDGPLGVGKGRSSGTGLPHLLELYNRLSSSGDDFNFSLRLNSAGTTMKLSFEGPLNTPAKLMESDPHYFKDISNMRGK
jgi:hypothetical protein